MRHSEQVDERAVTVAGPSLKLQHMSTENAKLFVCRAVAAEGCRLGRISDHVLALDSHRGRLTLSSDDVNNIAAITVVVPVLAAGEEVGAGKDQRSAAVRSLMRFFLVEAEDDVALGLQLCPTALMICLEHYVDNRGVVPFKEIVSSTRHRH